MMPTEASSVPLQIQRLRTADLADLLALVRACPEAPSWPAEAWEEFVLHDAGSPVSRTAFATRGREAGLTGLIAVTLLEDTTELELLLVHPDLRRKGIGRLLTAHWLAWAGHAGATEAVLEVRASNSGAQSLYRALGFEDQGWRARYYQRPVEDALLMRRPISLSSTARNSDPDQEQGSTTV